MRRSISNIISKVIKQTSLPSIYEVNVLAALEERWAFFLKGIDDGIIKIDDTNSKYE